MTDKYSRLIPGPRVSTPEQPPNPATTNAEQAKAQEQSASQQLRNLPTPGQPTQPDCQPL
ncbi:MAG: hypothetical protein WCI73_20985 [Phycisphaerae bacterium]